MFFKSTQNQTILSIYYILWDIFITFSAFILFFGIFIKVFFVMYEDFLIKKYIYNALSYYLDVFINLKGFNLMTKFINKNLLNKEKLPELEAESAKTQDEVNSYNAKYDNLLLFIIGGLIIAFLFLLLLPVLLGFISSEHLNFKYIGLNFIIHLIFIVIFEIIILFGLLPLYNPINLYNYFDGAGL
jgi:hypothetical protein